MRSSGKATLTLPAVFITSSFVYHRLSINYINGVPILFSFPHSLSQTIFTYQQKNTLWGGITYDHINRFHLSYVCQWVRSATIIHSRKAYCFQLYQRCIIEKHHRECVLTEETRNNDRFPGHPEGPR